MKRHNHGLTLFEYIFALTVGVLILLPMGMGFRLALKNWEMSQEETELVQHARVAMARITSDLRYAVRATNWTNPEVLEGGDHQV